VQEEVSHPRQVVRRFLLSSVYHREWSGKGERAKQKKSLQGITSSGFIATMKGFPPMNRLNDSFGRNAIRLLGVLFIVSLLTSRHFASGETVRFVGDSYLIGDVGRWTRAVAEEWAKKTNNSVEYIGRPADATSTLQLYLQFWGSKSGDVDVYMVDVIWQGIVAPHAVDLKKYVKDDEIKEFFPRSIENNTVNGRLVSIPWFIDAGLLYYRTDLLEKYGYKAPPKTWEELAEMARRFKTVNVRLGSQIFRALFSKERPAKV